MPRFILLEKEPHTFMIAVARLSYAPSEPILKSLEYVLCVLS